jgi:hypothetical protein
MPATLWAGDQRSSEGETVDFAEDATALPNGPCLLQVDRNARNDPSWRGAGGFEGRAKGRGEFGDHGRNSQFHTLCGDSVDSGAAGGGSAAMRVITGNRLSVTSSSWADAAFRFGGRDVVEADEVDFLAGAVFGNFQQVEHA